MDAELDQRAAMCAAMRAAAAERRDLDAVCVAVAEYDIDADPEDVDDAVAVSVPVPVAVLVPDPVAVLVDDDESGRNAARIAAARAARERGVPDAVRVAVLVREKVAPAWVMRYGQSPLSACRAWPAKDFKPELTPASTAASTPRPADAVASASAATSAEASAKRGITDSRAASRTP